MNPSEFKVMRVRECEAVELVDTPERAFDYWLANIPQSDWFDPCKEAFVVLVLNTRKRIIGHNLVTLGLVDQCLVQAREVFRPAIVAAGKSIVLIHNHPSGDPTPSGADIKITQDLIKAGRLLGIEVVDHLVIGHKSQTGRGFLSMKECGLFYE